jgi:hypothetical protein
MIFKLASRMRHLALGGICLVLTGIVTLELVAPLSTPGPAATDAAAEARPPSEAGKAPAEIAALIRGVLERPLFTPGRRPPPEPDDSESDEDDDQEPETQPLAARLAGVFVGPNSSEALFAKEGEDAVAVREGGEIDGWTVDTIETDRVVLSSPGGELVLLPTPAEPAARGANNRRGAARKPVAAKPGPAPAAKTPAAAPPRAASPTTVSAPARGGAPTAPVRAKPGAPAPAGPAPKAAVPTQKSFAPAAQARAPQLAVRSAQTGRDP